MERINFERVVPTDLNRFRPLVEAYWLEIMPHADTVSTSDGRDSYFADRFSLSNTEPRVFWGLSGGSPVGFISFAISGASAKINDFYVVPSKRRRGIGTFLVKSAIEITDSMGVDRIDLNVPAGQSRSFEILGSTRIYDWALRTDSIPRSGKANWISRRSFL